jgi:hypothetical protein
MPEIFYLIVYFKFTNCTLLIHMFFFGATIVLIRGSFKKYVDNVAPLQIICQIFKINTLYFVKTFILWMCEFSLQLVKWIWYQSISNLTCFVLTEQSWRQKDNVNAIYFTGFQNCLLIFRTKSNTPYPLIKNNVYTSELLV